MCVLSLKYFCVAAVLVLLLVLLKAKRITGRAIQTKVEVDFN